MSGGDASRASLAGALAEVVVEISILGVGVLAGFESQAVINPLKKIVANTADKNRMVRMAVSSQSDQLS